MKLQARTFSTEIKQIDLDVNRTFRNHIMFRDRFGVKWVQISVSNAGILSFLIIPETDLWVTLSQDSTDLNIVGPDHLWSLTCFYCLRCSLPAIFCLLHLHIPELIFVFPLTSHCSAFPLHNFSQGVTSGSNLEAAAHTKPKRRFPHLCVVLAFLSEHKAPQETAFAQKCALTSVVHLKPMGIKSTGEKNQKCAAVMLRILEENVGFRLTLGE